MQVWLSFNLTKTHQQEVTVLGRLKLKLSLHKCRTNQCSWHRKNSPKQRNSVNMLRRWRAVPSLQAFRERMLRVPSSSTKPSLPSARLVERWSLLRHQSLSISHRKNRKILYPQQCQLFQEPLSPLAWTMMTLLSTWHRLVLSVKSAAQLLEAARLLELKMQKTWPCTTSLVETQRCNCSCLTLWRT